MARPIKNGLDYFPTSVNFYDKTVKMMIKKFGHQSAAIYLYILCEIYRQGYYAVYDEDLVFSIALELQIQSDNPENLIGQVISFLCKRSLLDNKLFTEDKVLTSRSIQETYLKAKGEVKCSKIYWLLENSEQPSIKVTQNKGFSPNNPSFSPNNPSFSPNNSTKKSKVKESKEKQSKVEESRAAEPPSTSLYGFCKNVPLTDEQFSNLQSEFPSYYRKYIDKVSNYINRGRKYADPYSKILEWIHTDHGAELERERQAKERRSFDMNEINEFNIFNDPDFEEFL